MNDEMEYNLTILMSNKGSYPKYIKTQTIQRTRSMQGISLRNWGNFRLSEALQITQK